MFRVRREDLENRNLLRMRHLLVRKSTRIKNEIKSMMGFYGARVSDSSFKRSWSKKHLRYLQSVKMRFQTGDICLKLLLDELNYYNCVLAKLTQSITELSEGTKYKEDADNLRTVPGIGTLSAMVLLTEIINIRRFKSLNKLNNFAGLIPSEHSSGERENRNHITRRGNSYVKAVLIESAWVATRRDPALLMSFKQYCRTMNPNKAIIKVARKLLNRIRYILLNKKPYVIGITQ